MTSSSVRRCVAPSQVLGFAEDNTHGRIGRPQAAIFAGRRAERLVLARAELGRRVDEVARASLDPRAPVWPPATFLACPLGALSPLCGILDGGAARKKDLDPPGGLIMLCRCPALASTKVVSGPNNRAVP